MKKVIEDLNVFGKYFRARQLVSYEIQTSTFLLKTSLKLPSKLLYPVEKQRGNSFG